MNDTNDAEPRRLSDALTALYWSPATLAEIIGARTDTVRKWLSGRSDILPHVLPWLERLAAFHRANPPPRPPPRESE